MPSREPTLPSYGLRHDGIWMHVGTPQALDDANAFLRDL